MPDFEFPSRTVSRASAAPPTGPWAGQVTINCPQKPDNPPKTFTYDAVFGEDTQQKYFYEESCYSLVENVMEGFNGTIFA